VPTILHVPSSSRWTVSTRPFGVSAPRPKKVAERSAPLT
jgi:hypothetical protein